jgi:hypothetical protein
MGRAGSADEPKSLNLKIGAARANHFMHDNRLVHDWYSWRRESIETTTSETNPMAAEARTAQQYSGGGGGHDEDDVSLSSSWFHLIMLAILLIVSMQYTRRNYLVMRRTMHNTTMRRQRRRMAETGQGGRRTAHDDNDENDDESIVVEKDIQRTLSYLQQKCECNNGPLCKTNGANSYNQHYSYGDTHCRHREEMAENVHLHHDLMTQRTGPPRDGRPACRC